MRIEAYTQVQQLYQSQKVSRTQKTQKTAHTDRLQISNQGKDFQTAKAAVAAAPDIREELTVPLRQESKTVLMEWTMQALRRSCFKNRKK